MTCMQRNKQKLKVETVRMLEMEYLGMRIKVITDRTDNMLSPTAMKHIQNFVEDQQRKNNIKVKRMP